MKHCDSKLHVRGESAFVDDVETPFDLLHGAVFSSPVAHGKITALDTQSAMQVPGVVRVLTRDDIPGNCSIGAIVQNEPVFSHGEVMYCGQPIALVVAESRSIARKAAALIKVSIDLLEVITCPREAVAKGRVFAPTRTLSKGDVHAAWADCVTVVSGQVDLGGQEHVYLETHRARAVPVEDGQVRLHVSTQSPSAVQRSVASVLGIPLHKVEVDVKRLGGGFGGKEDQASPWACMVALAASQIGRPVQLVLSRQDDMRMTGKRHPYLQDYKIGLDGDGKILAYQVSHYQNSGALLDLSPAVLERTMLHSTSAYAIPNVLVEATMCQTNLPPNTAFRGFGGPQGMYPLEAAIYKAATLMGVAPDWIQARNLIADGYIFPYGQTLEDCQLRRTWERVDERFELAAVQQRIAEYNETSAGSKKGYALMPVCFGISFVQTFLNQGSSLVHIYTDGSVSVATGGVEMGQGVSSKIIAIAAQTLGISSRRIRYNSTNTSRIANMSPTAASSTTDLNGNATIVACEKILIGMKAVAARLLNTTPELISIGDGQVCVQGSPVNLTWDELVGKTYELRHPLMAHGFYSPPELHFDPEERTGHPFTYYTCGTCLVEVTVDCLLGRYTIDAVRLVHHLGRSIVPGIDIGQVEGGLAQGIGWVTLEELVYDQHGQLKSDSLSTYKLPNGSFLPDRFDIEFIEDTNGSCGPLGSKAVGEPPFMYGIAAFFALQKAIDAFVEQQDGGRRNRQQAVVSPMTPERVLLGLYPDTNL
jgi:xanthine dehydrogenase large subunit